MADIVEKGEGAIALSPTNIDSNCLTYEKDNTYISTYKYEESPEIKIFAGDIIFVKTGSTVGKVAFVDNIIDRTTLNPQLVVLKQVKCNPYFLYLLMAAPCFQKHIKRITVGGAVPTLSQNEMGRIGITLPPNAEQDRISALFKLLNYRIETQKKIIEKYESLIRGLYQFLFQQAKYDHFVSLGDISQISNGNSDVKDASMYNDGSLYPFFDRSDEIKFLPEYLFDKEAIIYPGEGAEFYPRYYNGKFALHQRCYAVYDISTDFIPRYLYHYCKTQNSYFVRNAVGSTVASLRLDTFKRLKIPAIPTHHQESLVMFLDKIEAKIECNRTILKKYEEQKKYLLFTLFI